MKKMTLTVFFYPISRNSFFIVHTDESLSVRAALFSDKKVGELAPPKLTKMLDDYFLKGVSLPQCDMTQMPGTDFTKKVLKAISEIKLGKTATYKEIATKVGHPKAFRAVGSVCSKNALALFIPCHRVVKSNGEDFSYAWGSERKKWLLLLEKSF